MADNNPIQVPSQFMFNRPPSLPQGMKTETLRINPLNQLSSTPGTIISHQLPQIPGGFVDPQSMYYSIQATFGFTLNAYTTVNYQTGSFILGTSAGLSMFQRMSVYFGGQQLVDDIFQPGQLAHFLTRSVANSSEIQGMSAAGQGTQHVYTDGTLGTSCPNVGFHLAGPGSNVSSTSGVNTQNVNLTFQIPGVLGCNQEKVVPLGIAPWRIDLTVDSISNFIANVASATCAVAGFTINQMELVCNVVYPPPQALAEIMAQSPVLYLKNTSYTLVTSNLPAAAGAGTYQIPLSSQRASLRSLMVLCSPANLPELGFGSVCPNLVAGSGFILGGVLVPQQGQDPCNRPASVFSDLQNSWGSQASILYNGCLLKSGYYVSSAACGLMNAYNATAGNILKSPNSFVWEICTEKFSRRGYLLSGSTLPTSSQLQMVVGATLANQVHNLSIWLCYDVVLQLDLTTGQLMKFS